MVRAAKHTDVRTVSDLERLVEEIREADAPRVLTRDDEEVAVVFPLRTPDRDAQKTAGRRRSGVIGPDDALMNIVGVLCAGRSSRPES